MQQELVPANRWRHRAPTTLPVEAFAELAPAPAPPARATAPPSEVVIPRVPVGAVLEEVE
jgi:hypothetical protein